jgi:polyhydroxybutyrate depolymerase
MKTKAACWVFVVWALASQTAWSQQDSSHVLSFGGRDRTYEVHLPPKYDGKTKLPVVLNLHGGGGNAKIARVQSQMDRTSNQYGFIVVYPEGTSSIDKYYTWNAGICCAYSVVKNIDDVGFIKTLIDELPQQFAIDSKRVYATGMSNGGMMAYRLACEIPDKVAAVSSVACSMGVKGPSPSRPVPIMEIHGMKDPNAPYYGGVGANAISKVQHRPVREVIAWWCSVNRCQTRPTGTITAADYTMENYDPGAGRPGAPVILYSLLEGGHTWPGGIDVTPNSGTGKHIASFNSNVVMWEFFRQFSLK